MRPINCTMMGFAVFVGALLAAPQLLQANWLNVVYGFFTGFLLCAAAMTINDYYDRGIDAVNEPTRPIPSGSIGTKTALTFVFALTAVGLFFAYLSSMLFSSMLYLAIAATSWIITVGSSLLEKEADYPATSLSAHAWQSRLFTQHRSHERFRLQRFVVCCHFSQTPAGK